MSLNDLILREIGNSGNRNFEFDHLHFLLTFCAGLDLRLRMIDGAVESGSGSTTGDEKNEFSSIHNNVCPYIGSIYNSE